ncbi:MAG: protease inhibitor I42 family protein [Myxococcales bacterium]|nr:protease inhibitor I42 family protein [Myxococcales bacterium]
MINRLVVLGLCLAITLAVAPTDDSWDETNDGKTVSLQAGRSATLTLTMAAGTGYKWELAPVDAAVLAVAGPEIEPSKDPLLMGGPVKMRWTLTAKGAGEVELKARLIRSWQADQPAKTVTIRVTVQ